MALQALPSNRIQNQLYSRTTVTFSYSLLEIKLVGPSKKARLPPMLPEKMHYISQGHSQQRIEASHTAGTLKNSVMYRE